MVAKVFKLGTYKLTTKRTLFTIAWNIKQLRCFYP